MIVRTVVRTCLAAACVSALWFHLGFLSMPIFPPIIDEYMITAASKWMLEGKMLYRDIQTFHFPGNLYLHAAALKIAGNYVGAARAAHVVFLFLTGAATFFWVRHHEHSAEMALICGLFVSSAGPYLWPVITHHIPPMAFYVLGCLCLFDPRRSRGPGLFLSGVCFFLSGWFLQTYLAIGCLTIAGSFAFDRSEDRLRRLGWIFAGYIVPLAIWMISLVGSGQWPAFYEKAILFLFTDFKKPGGINDVNFLNVLGAAVSHEPDGFGKMLVLTATFLSLTVVFGAPCLGLFAQRRINRALLPAAWICPFIYLSGRTDPHHAFYLMMPGLLLLTSFRFTDPPAGRAVFNNIVAASSVALCVLMFGAFLPYLPALARFGIRWDDPPVQERRAREALYAMGVSVQDPVAVFPWSSNLYMFDVVPGHSYVFVSPPRLNYYGGKEWDRISREMLEKNVRWVAFFPLTDQPSFQTGGEWMDFLKRPNEILTFVGAGNGLSLWRYDLKKEGEQKTGG